MKIVLDTNIYLSGLIFCDSPPAKVLELAKTKQFKTYCSSFIVNELKKNLIIKFDFSPNKADMLIDEILKFVYLIKSDRKVSIIKEKDTDNRILECALASDSDYLVTGDKKHILPLKKVGNCKIVSAREFIEKLG